MQLLAVIVQQRDTLTSSESAEAAPARGEVDLALKAVPCSECSCSSSAALEALDSNPARCLGLSRVGATAAVLG